MKHDARLWGLSALLIGANVAAWLWAWAAFAQRPSLLGLALLAWVFGLRHAVDADHIAAIDNAVRKLMQDGQRPIGVGCYFSLGHSTVVVLVSVAVAAAASSLHGRWDALQAVGGVIGTTVSAVFLLLIALANLAVLPGIWRSFRAVARGDGLDQQALDTLLNGRGLLARLLRPVFRAISRSWHMYPVGFLFGLGFDTATEVGVLGIAATQAAQGVPAWHIMVFPALFTAGMSLIDTLDGVLMLGVYSWAFVRPIRKLWYNLTITAASVVVALVIGAVEALGLIGGELGLRGGIWAPIAALNDDMANVGFLVIGIFLLVWGISAAIYRRKRGDALPQLALAEAPEHRQS
ncbi:MAG: HoxN/HupN/NixA family nickel/cobalt transporter [Acetobacteraceae bacterium]|jgi:high-affinity nickel-transport protein